MRIRDHIATPVRLSGRSVAATLLTLIALGSGCASSPKPRLHVFAVGTAADQPLSRDAAGTAYTVLAKEIRLPTYVDRPQMVSRVSDAELKADEFNRWGIPLSSGVSRQLGLTLMAELPDAYVDLRPWQGQKDADFLVDVAFLRMDGKLGGQVEVEAQWSVSTPADAGTTVARRLSRHAQAAADESHAAYVDALRLAVQELGKEIAAAIRGCRGAAAATESP
jgi:hypothetical protein